MKLLYLWIEDYKNIKQQGFNFSGEYKFDFNPETNELTCDDTNKNDYIEDFFGENIDVTAIVGKNGSGKSSVLKVMLALIYNKYTKKNRIEDCMKAFLIFNDKNNKKKLLSLNMLNLNIIIKNKEIKDLEKNKITFFTIHFNYTIDTLQDKEEIWVDELYHNADTYKKPILSEPNKKDALIDLDNLEYYLINRMFLDYFRRDNKNNFLEKNIFTPNMIKLSINKWKLENKINQITTYEKKKEKILETLDECIKEQDYEKINKFYINFKLYKDNKVISENLKYLKDNALKKDIENLLKSLRAIKRINNLNSLFSFDKEDLDKLNLFLNKTNIPDFKIMKLKQAIRFYINFKEIEKKFKETVNGYEAIKIDKVKEIIDFIPPWIEIDFIENKENSPNRGILELNKENLDGYENILKNYIRILKYNSNYGFKEIKEINEILYEKDSSKLNFKNFNSFIINKEKSKIIENMINDYVDITEKEREIIQKLPFCLKMKVSNSGKSFKSLSNGEKTIFFFIINILFHINAIIETNNYSTINIFIDELELQLHPEWQKQYLKVLISSLKEYKKIHFNLVLTAHSPFILSDIPKSNIIFLDKDDKGNCKVLKDEALASVSDTFGANIHTLLADSFFMKNGTMGEFAKGKINDVITFLNLKLNDEPKYLELNISQEEAKHIISIIGEPFLKEKLEEMYFRAFGDDKDARREALLRKKREIEKELEGMDD